MFISSNYIQIVVFCIIASFCGAGCANAKSDSIESGAKTDQELPSTEHSMEVQVLMDVSATCSVPASEMDFLADWLKKQFQYGNNLRQIRMKVEPRGRFVELVILGGTGARMAVFEVDRVKVRFYLDLTERFVKGSSITIECR